MDSLLFDDLARLVGTATSRRRAVRTLTAVLGSGLLGLVAPGEAGAARRCRPSGHPCREGTDCCTGFCLEPSDDPKGTRRCGCPKDCNGTCIPADACCTHADCDDGNGCTLDLCGPGSHTCRNAPIGEACVPCAADGDCAGGPCCGGRCCPAGGTCSTNAQGIPVCCLDCEKSSCCDDIEYYQDCEAAAPCVVYFIDLATCVEAEGICAECGGECAVGKVSVRVVGAGNGRCGVDNACQVGIVLPGGSHF